MDLGLDFIRYPYGLTCRAEQEEKNVFINPGGILRLVENLLSLSMACTISHAGPRPDQDREVL